MARMLWLADTLRAAGLPVREIDGWRTRGHGDMASVLGVLCHHTAGAASGAYPSERVVVNGRPGLAGPLANLGLDRNGTWIVVAAGQAWHAGSGSASWCPANQGNSHLIGVEAESVGTRDDWTPAQRANYPRGVAALLAHIGAGPSRAIGHKEWAPGRKIDPAFWDMNAFRVDVARWLRAPSPTPRPAPRPVTTLEGFLMALTDAEQREILDGIRKLKPGVVLPSRSPHSRAQRDDSFGAALNAWAEAADARAAIEAVAARLATGGSGPAQLSDTDVQRIAAAVITELSRRSAA